MDEGRTAGGERGTGIVAIWAACASADEAERIAATLVDERLAACVQIDRVQSCYRWEGVIERVDEWRIMVKTTAARAEAVVARVVALHSYAVPEVLVTPVTGGNAGYLEWVEREVG